MDNVKISEKAITQIPKLVCSLCGSKENIKLAKLGSTVVISTCSGCLPTLNDLHLTICKCCENILWETKEYYVKRTKNQYIYMLAYPQPFISMIHSCICCNKEDYIFDEYNDFQREPIQQTWGLFFYIKKVRKTNVYSDPR